MLINDKALIDSVRHIDENGYLHVDVSNLTKEQVVPYRGNTIPNYMELNLEPGKVYMLYRPGNEIEAGAGTFNGLPLMLEHHEMDADNIPKEQVMGSLGTDARYEAPYLKNSLIVTDSKAIKAIEDGSYAELSASYFCDVEMEGGIFDGVSYDGIMRNIRGNHVALVREGRAGHDVRVEDSNDLAEGGEQVSNWVEKIKETLLEIITDKEALTEIMAVEEKNIVPDEGTEMNEAPAVVEETEQATDTEPVDEVADEIREMMKSAGLDPDDEAAQKAFIAGMAAGKVAEDSCKDAEPEAVEEVEEVTTASDSAMVHDKAFYAGLYKAAEEVAPFVGKINNPFEFDSAADIYKKALDKNGVVTDGIDPSAFGALVAMLKRPEPITMAKVEDDPINKMLKNIKSV